MQPPVPNDPCQSFLQYLRYEKRSSEHTCVAYETDLAQFHAFCLSIGEEAGFSIGQASWMHVRQWIVDLMGQGLSPRSVNRKIACLQSFYKFLMKRGHISVSPIEKLQTLKTGKKLPVFVKESEMEQVETLPIFPETQEGLRDRVIIELLYGTGIRLSELIGLKVSDVSLNKKQLKVLGKRSKERMIPLHNDLVDLLTSYIQSNELNPHDFLIRTNSGAQAYPVFIQRIVKKYLSLISNADKKSPHVLRHTFATHVLNAGAELKAIKDILGHSSLAATQVYTHNSLDRLKSVFNKAHPKAKKTS